MLMRSTPGAEPIDLMIEDLPLQQAVSAERLMFHPEHSGDFSDDGGYDGEFINHFGIHPFDDLKIDRQLGLSQQTTSPNCLLLDRPDIISGLSRLRKEELSVHRPYLNPGPRNDTTAGKYQVSIVMSAKNTVTASGSNPALRMRLHSLPNTVTMEIPASAFYDGSNGLITHRAIEYYLGEVELRQDTQGGNPYWIDWRGGVFPITAADAGRFNPPGISFADIDAGMFDSVDVSIEYLNGTIGEIYIDAICLSSPAGYALFLYDSAQVHPDFANTHANFDNRLHHVLFDMSDDLHDRLRLIYGREQDWNSGAWRATKLASLELKAATSGGVRMYSTTSAWSSPKRTTELMDLNLDAASGYYHYPIHWELPKPLELDPEYYERFILDTNYANLQFTINRYHGFAMARKEWGTHAPWIPIVQNHSNIFNYPADQYDGDPLREPTAAEVRVQCNLALAYGADGIMFSQFSQVPLDPMQADVAYWPSTRAEWEQDPGKRDMNMGSIGFLNGDNTERMVDTHGENKWDSTIVTIAKTRTLGQFMIDEGLRWQWGKSWFSARPGSSDLVTNVVSRRLNNVNPVDPATETLVQTTEFKAPDGTDYIFVLNCRTDSLGHRDITVKLNTKATEWIVENVLTHDVWLVRPTSTPDPTSDAHGFTEYFAPGAGALYRVKQKTTNSLQFLQNCFAHTFTVTPGAYLSMVGVPIRLTTDGCIVIEDSVILNDCPITCCDLEGYSNIHIRNGGQFDLHGTALSPDNSSLNRVLISAGPGTGILSTRTMYSGITYGQAAVNLVDATATFESNAVDLAGGGHFIQLWGNSRLRADKDSVQGSGCCWTVGLHASGGTAFITNQRYLNLTAGIWATNGAYVQGCDSAAPALGRNKIRATDFAMYCENSEIFFGERPWGTPGNWYASQNSIGVADTNIGFHAYVSSGTISAYANFWGQGSGLLQHCPPHHSGSVTTGAPLQGDPVPFTGSTGSGLSKSMFSATPPPSGIRATVLGYLAVNARADARRAMASFLQNGGGATASIQDLAFLHRTARQVDGQTLVAGILAALDNRQDLRSKLLATDILEEEDDILGALSVLDSYSFAGSDTLLRDALLRKAILHPQAGPGGYAHGVAVLDTLATLVAFDSTLAGFIERYPRLMSNLSRRGRSATPKSAESSRFQQALPDGIDVWPNYPNPFSDLTSFTFKLGEDRHVRLAVYDAMGREVAVVTDADYPRGVHSAVLRSSGLPSGLYFYRLTTDTGVIQRKMLLMR